jgi:hypothetical protein
MTSAVERAEFGHGEEWFTSDGQSQDGPFTVDAIVRAAFEGKLRGSDYLWKAGMPNWVSVRDLIDIPPTAQREPALTSASMQFPPQVHAPAAAEDNQRPSIKEPLVGLGGWLILVAMHPVIAIIVASIYLFYAYLSFEELNLSILKFELMLSPFIILGILYPLLLLFMFFRRKAVFPRYFIIWFSIVATMGVLSYLVEFVEAFRLEILGRAIVWIAVASLWIMYLRRSKRVKATFVWSFWEKGAWPW